MEIGNVLKIQQPDKRAENSPRLPMGLQHSLKYHTHSWASAGSITKMCTSSVKKDVRLNSKTYEWTKIEKNIQDQQRPEAPDLGLTQKCGGVKHVLWDHNPDSRIYDLGQAHDFSSLYSPFLN